MEFLNKMENCSCAEERVNRENFEIVDSESSEEPFDLKNCIDEMDRVEQFSIRLPFHSTKILDLRDKLSAMDGSLAKTLDTKIITLFNLE